jgi:hypothetical protein
MKNKKIQPSTKSTSRNRLGSIHSIRIRRRKSFAMFAGRFYTVHKLRTSFHNGQPTIFGKFQRILFRVTRHESLIKANSFEVDPTTRKSATVAI